MTRSSSKIFQNLIFSFSAVVLTASGLIKAYIQDDKLHFLKKSSKASDKKKEFDIYKLTPEEFNNTYLNINMGSLCRFNATDYVDKKTPFNKGKISNKNI